MNWKKSEDSSGNLWGWNGWREVGKANLARKEKNARNASIYAQAIISWSPAPTWRIKLEKIVGGPVGNAIA
jgi:hypothetical protein